MSAPTTRTPAPAPTATTKRRVPLYFSIAAWAVPIMVIGQFSMIAIAPVLVVFITVLVDPRVRALRWWSVGLTVAYAIPLAIYYLRPAAAESLSKDMHPGLLALIVAAGVALLARMYVRRR